MSPINPKTTEREVDGLLITDDSAEIIQISLSLSPVDSASLDEGKIHQIGEGRHSKLWEIWHNIGGLLMMLCSTIVFSGMTTVTKLAGNEGIPTMQIVLLRSMVMWCLVAGFSLVYLKKSPFGPRKLYPILALRGFVGACGLSAATAAILRLSLSESMSVIFTNPILTSLFAVIFLKEKWELFDGLVSILAFVGVIFVARPTAIFGDLGMASGTGESENVRLIFVGVAFIAAIFIAFAYVVIRKIGKRVHAFVIVGYFAFCSMLVAPIGFLFEPFIMPSGKGWFLVVCIGVLAFTGQSFLSLGLQLEQASKASNMMYMQIPLAFFWDLVVFNAPPSLLAVIGAICILAAALSTGVRRWRKNSRQSILREEEEPSVIPECVNLEENITTNA